MTRTDHSVFDTVDLTHVMGGARAPRPNLRQVAKIMRGLHSSLKDLASHHRETGVSDITHLAPFVAGVTGRW